MRIHEMVNLDISYVEQQGSLLVIRLPKSINKNKKKRSFVIDDVGYVSTVMKYRSLRPEAFGGRFFVNYVKKSGKCTKQFIGRNKLAKIPVETAEFLNLEDAKLYTGRYVKIIRGVGL